MRVSRRGFFQAVGGTAGVAAVVGGKLATAEQAGHELGRWATPEDVIVPSICQQCPGGCGILVRTLDGEAAGIAGNPVHPVNRGALCPKAFGGLQLVYDPNRLGGPLVRDRESGRQRPIAWDEALSIVGARLADLRARGLAHTVAIVGGQYRGYRDTLWRRFAGAYGTPNYVRARCLRPEQPALAHELMQGVTSPLAYDIAEARFVLSFGVSFLESWQGPVHASQAFARFRGGERPRGRFVHVDPRRSLTAAKADQWVPIVPGTDGILALGIANALIREGRYDKDFAEEHAAGFEDWVDGSGQTHIGFKNLVHGQYSLTQVSRATGVPIKTILNIARDLSVMKPALVIGERGPAYGHDDVHTRMAIHSLNALVGNIGVRGGVVGHGELPLAPLPRVEQDETARRGAAQPRLDGAGRGEYLLAPDAFQALPERILGSRPYPVNVLFLVGTNPLSNHPARARLSEALAHVPLVVSFSPFLDATTAVADLVLPDHTYLERWQDDPVTHLPGFTCFSVSRPAVSARQQTRDTGDVLLALASGVGGSVAASFRWTRYEDVVREGARGLFAAGRGYVVSGSAEESLRKILERQGYWTPEFDAYDAFWEALVQRGAWWDPTEFAPGRRALLKTASGKFEFYSTRLKARVDEAAAREGRSAAIVRALGGQDRGDLLFLPAVSVTTETETPEFPFRLNTYRLATRPLGGGGNQPWLLEQPAVHVRAAWEGWVEIHPDAAARLGIKDGDRVWLQSPRGRVQTTARLYAGTVESVVHMPLFGGRGANPNDLIAVEADPFRGFGLFNTTRVRVERA